MKTGSTGCVRELNPFAFVTKSTRRYAFALLSLALSLASAAGCATRMQRAAPFVPPSSLETRDDINALLLKSYGNINALKASGDIAFRRSSEENWRSASIALMVRRPNEVRARAYRLLTPTLFEFVSNGTTCWLLVPEEQTAYVDNNCGIIESNRERFVISAGTIISSLLVISDCETLLSSPGSLSHEDDAIRLSLVEKGGMQRELWIDSVSRLVTRQVLSTSEGKIEADIQYLEYATRDDSIVPVKVEVMIPEAQAALRLHLDQVDPNPRIPPDAFRFSPPRNVRIIDLDEAQW